MPGEDIKTTLQFQTDITDFKGAMQEASRAVKLANSEFAEASSGMDDWSKSTDGITAKLKQLATVQAAEERKLDVLKTAYAEVVKEQGENSKAAEELKIKINNQQATVNKTKKAYDNYAKSLEDAEGSSEDLDDATGDTKKEIDKFSDAAGDAGKKTKEMDDAAEDAEGGLLSLEKAGAAVTATMTAVAGAVAGAVTAFFASAEATREYRRAMSQMAQNATDTGHDMEKMKDILSGVSAVTGEADAAMEGMNMLMASGLDTQDLEMAAEAFSGAATRFSGLKFEGMAEGLQESLATGQAVGPFAELIERSGYNLEEFNAGMAACTTEADRQRYAMDWLAKSGLKDVHDAYVETNKDLVEAEEAQFRFNDAMAEIGAIAEPVMTSLKNMGTDLLTTMTPFVALIGEGLTGALNGSAGAAGTLAEGIGGLLTSLVEKFTEMVPLLLEVVATVFPTVITAIVEALPTVIDAVVQVVPQLVNALLGMLPMLLEMLISISASIITGIADMLPGIVEAVVAIIPQLITSLLDNLPVLLEACITLLMAIVDAVPTITEALVEAIPLIINSLLDFFTNNFDTILDAAVTLFMAIVEAIPQIILALAQELPNIVTKIITGIGQAVPKMAAKAKEIFNKIITAAGDLIRNLPGKMGEIGSKIINGIGGFLADVGTKAGEIATTIWNAISSLPEQALSLGKNLVEGIWNGISGAGDWLWQQIVGFGDSVVGWFKGIFGIHSPSKVMEEEVGEMLGAGIAGGIKASQIAVMGAVQSMNTALGGATAGQSAGTAAAGKSITLNQYISSPKATSRREIYRQTNNALAMAGGM